MASLNRATLIGHLGQDPEVRYLPNGDAVTNISIATSETWTDKKTDEKKESTEWHRVVFYSKLAEVVGEYLHKGSQIYVEGKIETKKWTDKAGQDRYTTQIRADKMVMLGKPSGDRPPAEGSKERPAAPKGDYQAASGGTKKSPPQKGGSFDDLEDDIPF